MKKVQVVWHSVFHHLLNLLRELEKEVDDVQILVLEMDQMQVWYAY